MTGICRMPSRRPTTRREAWMWTARCASCGPCRKARARVLVRPGPNASSVCDLDDANVGRLRALRSLRHFVADLLTLVQRLEAVCLDCGEVHEDFFAVIALNKAVA